MQLTGKDIIAREIVSNYDEKRSVQQQGVDLRVSKVRMVNPAGQFESLIPVDGRTKLPEYKEIFPTSGIFTLRPGYYELELMEGITIPHNVAAYIKTRSSLVRCGAIVHSGQFDAGFSTDVAGCFLHVLVPVVIQQGARVAQLICHESGSVTNTYAGQWQGV